MFNMLEIVGQCWEGQMTVVPTRTERHPAVEGTKAGVMILPERVGLDDVQRCEELVGKLRGREGVVWLGRMSVREKVSRGLKRRRSSAATEAAETPENEDISSEESDLDEDNDEADEDLSSEEDLDETAADKRIRLAKHYLSELGVDENESADGEELEAIARREKGLITAEIADGAKSVQETISIGKKAHRLSVTSVDLVGSGSAAVSGGKDRRVNLWDVENCKVVCKFLGGDPQGNPRSLSGGHTKSVLSVAITDDGNLVASAGEDKVIRIWDAKSAKCVQSFGGHNGTISSLAFRLGTKQLVSASFDRTLKMFDLDEMAYVETLFGHGAEVISVDALSKERYLSGGMDGSLRLWKISEGSQLVFKSSTQSIDAVAYIDDSLFLTGASDGTISLWGPNKKKPLGTEKIGSSGVENGVVSVAACAYSDLCATGLQSGKLNLWKAAGSKAQRYFEAVKEFQIDGAVNGLKFNRSGSILAIASGQEHRLGRWSRSPSWRANAVRFVSIPQN